VYHLVLLLFLPSSVLVVVLILFRVRTADSCDAALGAFPLLDSLGVQRLRRTARRVRSV
jgi:hypothetical protein